MNRARRTGRIGADAVTGRMVAALIAGSAVLVTAACTQVENRHPHAEATRATGTTKPTPGPDPVDPPPSGATTPGSPTPDTNAPVPGEPPPALPAVEDAPTPAGETRAPAQPVLPRIPAKPSIAETNTALAKARTLRARGLDPRSDRYVKAVDHGCFAHESQPGCTDYLATRGLGRAYAAAITRDDPTDTRPRPPIQPVLPPGCVIAATVGDARAPKGFLLACTDYTPE
ncbi:hypothetical protein [Embleya sp. NPDC059259]|uniref:hypothetical protein n=1 Tax=unclassified Embleya TaxID=2699296 RepID=UPI0036952921